LGVLYFITHTNHSGTGIPQWFSTGLQATWSGVKSPGRGWEFFSSLLHPDWPWGSLSLLSIGYQGIFPLG